jgi:hypothetical protein
VRKSSQDVEIVHIMWVVLWSLEGRLEAAHHGITDLISTSGV